MQHLQQPATIRIEAPARLHLGFLDLNGSLGRNFGSIGLAIDKPSTILTISRARADRASSPHTSSLEAQRAQATLAQFKQALKLTGHYDIALASAIPTHAGLGSGTQMALAIGAGLAALENIKLPASTIADTLSRGARSAIGIGAFENGGFLVDGGRGANQKPAPIVSRIPFPENWRVLLVFDPAATGVHGAGELEAFDNLPPMPLDDVGAICMHTLVQLLPALCEHDLETFGVAVTKIQKIVGSYFAPAQGGGIWASPAVERIVRQMTQMGALGIGQSSWGPTGFAFVESQAAAESLYHSLKQEAKREGLDIQITRGRNHGAKIEISASAE